MEIWFLLTAASALSLVALVAYDKGRVDLLKKMGAIVIINKEDNTVRFATREAKQRFPRLLQKLKPEAPCQPQSTLSMLQIETWEHIPYRFRGQNCWLIRDTAAHIPNDPKTDSASCLIHSIIQSIPDAIGVMNEKLVYQACNQAFVEPLGIKSPEDLLGKTLEEAAREDIAEKFGPSDGMVLHTGKEFRVIDEVTGNNGKTKWIDARKFRYHNPHTNKPGLFILARDITEIELAKRELNQARDSYRKLSILDPLTQIGNRRMFDQDLQTEWQSQSRNSTPMSMIMCDIDEFKKLNDFFGHVQGDKVLSIVAKYLGHALIKQSHKVYRYGGEEFAFILGNTDSDNARTVADRIHSEIKKIQTNHEVSNVDGRLTVSLGVYSCFPNNDRNPIDALQLVDDALYQAKRAGRNQTVYLSDS
ncbi:TPA: sensor domain-containing diguanylate cyclase [Vibrio parahaemolyticus]